MLLNFNLLKCFNPNLLKITYEFDSSPSADRKKLIEGVNIVQFKDIISVPNINTILLTRSLPVEEFKGCYIINGVTLYSEQIDDAIVDQFIVKNAIPLTLLSLCDLHIESLIEELIQDADAYIIGGIAKQMQENFKIGFVKEKVKFLSDVVIFIRTLLDFTEAICIERLDRFVTLFEPIPGHIIPEFQQRLCILALHPQRLEVIFDLQERWKVKLHLLSSSILQVKSLIDTEVFMELTLSLPKRRKVADSFIDEFKRAIWETHLIRPDELHHLVIPKVHNEFTSFELLKQIVCFLLPNWKQIWAEMGFPMTFEVQKRLHLLKKKGWHPTVSDYVKCLLNL